MMYTNMETAPGLFTAFETKLRRTARLNAERESASMTGLLMCIHACSSPYRVSVASPI